jgi:hypothetical protein
VREVLYHHGLKGSGRAAASGCLQVDDDVVAGES